MDGLRILVQATSAASSFALFRNCPSYQYRAARFWFWTVTVADQAVRPPEGQLASGRLMQHGDSCLFGLRRCCRQVTAVFGRDTQLRARQLSRKQRRAVLPLTCKFLLPCCVCLGGHGGEVDGKCCSSCCRAAAAACSAAQGLGQASGAPGNSEWQRQYGSRYIYSFEVGPQQCEPGTSRPLCLSIAVGLDLLRTQIRIPAVYHEVSCICPEPVASVIFVTCYSQSLGPEKKSPWDLVLGSRVAQGERQRKGEAREKNKVGGIYGERSRNTTGWTSHQACVVMRFQKAQRSRCLECQHISGQSHGAPEKGLGEDMRNGALPGGQK